MKRKDAPRKSENGQDVYVTVLSAESESEERNRSSRKNLRHAVVERKT